MRVCQLGSPGFGQGAHIEWLCACRSVEWPEFLAAWLPARLGQASKLPPLPVAIHPAHITSRIIAQCGKFTVHGDEPIPIQQMFKQAHEAMRRDYLQALVIEDPHAVKADLDRLFVNDFRFFPEAQTLSDVLKRFYGVD